MTEFQTAALAIQEATLSAQHVANAQAFWFGFAQAGAVLAGVIVNAVLILKGLARMREAAAERSAELQAAQEDRHQQHAEAMQHAAEQHAEAMQHAAEQHAEAMQRAAQQHAEAMTALRAIIHGMEAVIERTEPEKGKSPDA